MKELRELVKKWKSEFAELKKDLFTENIIKMGILQTRIKQLELAIEAQEKREAEKVALIDKRIEEYEKDAYGEAIRRSYFNTSENTEGRAQGLEEAKSILQGEVIDETN